MSEDEIDEIDPTLEEVEANLQGTTRPEQIFGTIWVPGRKPGDVLRESYQSLMDQTAPSLYHGTDAELARDLQHRLKELYAAAAARFEAAAYGTASTPLPPRSRNWAPFQGTKLDLLLGDEVAAGTRSTVYEGARASGDELVGRLAIKVIDGAADNDRIWREKKALERMHEADGNQRSNLPALIDHFALDDGRLGLVTRFCESCVDLNVARASRFHRDGIDRKHVAWMLNRILAVTGYAHSLGIVHGNIEPAHLFLRPEDHNVFLIDWSWSALYGDGLANRLEARTPAYSAPEISRGATAHPSADLYSIGKCAIFALGGNVETNEMPDSVEPDFQKLVLAMAEGNPSRRKRDAWATWHELMDTNRRLWSKKKFLEFRV